MLYGRAVNAVSAPAAHLLPQGQSLYCLLFILVFGFKLHNNFELLVYTF